LLLIAATCVAAAPPPPPPPQAGPPPGDDESFIEFLGADDVGDARWWDYLANTEPRKDENSAPPPQDANK
jgi:hypothetical protein